MKQRKKSLGIWIFLLLLFWGQWIVPVKASGPELRDVDMQMLGGQIRTITPMGLRMIGCIKKSYLQELESSGAVVEYGMVLLPKTYLGEQELELDRKYLYNGAVYKPAKVTAVKKFSEDDDRIYFTAVLANLSKERYKNDYAARVYAKITRTISNEEGSSEKKTEIVYSDDTVNRQVYQIAQAAVDGTAETEENKEWLRENILNPVDQPEQPQEEEKKIPFELGTVSGVTLYHKTGIGEEVGEVEEVSHFRVEEFKPEQYIVKVEMEDQPEVFSEITKLIVSEDGKVSFGLKLDNYVMPQQGQPQAEVVVEFGTLSEGQASTKYITMQALVDRINADPDGTYTLEHDIDAGMVQGEDVLIPEFRGTFNGKGYKIKGLTTTLFGTISGGTVKNVKLENVSITKQGSYGDAGGGTLANKAMANASVEDVHVSGSLKTPNSRQLLGGLIGRMDYAAVRRCSANLEITGTFNTTGGLIGQMSNLRNVNNGNGSNIIENSYAVGTIRGNQTNGAIGGLIGWHNSNCSTSVTNCYTNVSMEVAKSNQKESGGFIGYIGNADGTGILKNNVSYSSGTQGYKFDGASEDTKYSAEGVSGLYSMKESRLKRESSRTGATALTKITESSVDTLSGKEFYTAMAWPEDVWNFAPLQEGKTPVLQNGDSNMTTMLQMKEISSVDDLRKIKDDLGGAYVLTTDLDVSEITEGNAIILGSFRGLLRGNGHQIIGMKLPLFETLAGASVEELKLTQGSIGKKDTDQVAALAKVSESGTTLRHVYVRDMSITGRTTVGGMIAVMKQTTAEACSVNAEVTGGNAGGFAAEILEGSVISNSYAKRAVDLDSFQTAEGPQGGFAAIVKQSQLSKNFGQLSWKKAEEKNETPATAGVVGTFIGESGTGDQTPTKIEHNISFGPASYAFVGNQQGIAEGENYVGNYEYREGDPVSSVLPGKIEQASEAQIQSKEFYLQTLEWQEDIWYLDDVVGGKRPRLQAEGDVYGTEENPVSVEAPEMIQEAIAVRSQEEAALSRSLEGITGYREDRKLLYENLQLFMPFYQREQIVLDGNHVDVSHILNQKRVLAVYPMDEQGRRIVALSDKTVNQVKKLRIQFADETTPLIYNMSYIDTRANIASYKVSQIPVHFNFKNYVVNTTSAQFQKLLETAKTYEFDRDIETRVAQKDSGSVLDVYRRNYNEVVKTEMEQVLVSMSATNAQYPINLENEIAKKIVTDHFLTSEYLKDFLYAYNYLDRWYDFEIGGINLRDVVLFDNSILKTGKKVRNLPTEIVKLSSNGGRQGNNTPSFYINRLSAYTGISNVASFVEYFMKEYAGYADVNDWIIDNFQSGFIVEARANNPKIQSRLWKILKNNTVQRNHELILPVLSYKTSKNLYLASFPSALIYGNLEIYSGYQDTEAWRQQKKQQVITQVNHFKTSYDNFVDVAENGANSINNSKFLIVDSSANKNHNQDVFKEFYRPLQTLWQHSSGAVAVIFGNPNLDYIYYNGSNFIGDLTVLNHEMGHVTDMWIWMENKGKRPGRNGEDYSNGFANQANVDYNMNFMKTYARDGSMMTNLTPDRINSPEEFQSYYKEVFDVIYTLDYLQGKAYLQLTPEQQARITLQHRYGTTNNHQKWNSANSTWRTIGAGELENMNLKTLDDLWDNQLTIRPGHRLDLRSFNEVGVNNLGAYQIDRACYASWYVPYVDNGTPNAQTFRRNGYELAGLYGYSNGLVEYLSGRTRTGDLQYFRQKTGNADFTFESYRKSKNIEIETKIHEQKEQGNAYFDEEALIQYLKQNMINYGNEIGSGASNGNNTLNHIKESRENVFRYLQRITDEFRTPVYGGTETRNAVSISTAEELVQKLRENPNGFYVLEKDISMKGIQASGEVYVDTTFIGKLDGNGHKITDAAVPLLRRTANSYIADIEISDTAGTKKDWVAQQKQFTIVVKEEQEETVQEIRTLEELRTLGENRYTKYVLKNEIDASSVTDAAVIQGTFTGELDGGEYAITGLQVPLFEKVQNATVRNLKLTSVNITNSESKNAAVAKESNHSTFARLSLEDIKISGKSYNAAVVGYDYTGSDFSQIQIRNAQIQGTGNYNAVFAGRASGSEISEIAVIDSKVTLSGTDCGGFIGAGKSLNIRQVYSGADMVAENYTDEKNRTNSAGFIGNLGGKSNVENVFAAGKVDNRTETPLYNFLGTPEVLESMVKNAFVLENAGGISHTTETIGILSAISEERTKEEEFYRASMNFSEEIWNLSLVAMKGYPELRGMEKKEIIEIHTPEDFLKMKAFPGQEYHLKADINLTGAEGERGVIPEFTGVLDGQHYKITGLQKPLFDQLKGSVRNLAIEGSTVELSDTPETVSGILANTMEDAVVEKVLLHGIRVNSAAGKAAAVAGTVRNTTMKNLFVEGAVQAASTAAGVAVTTEGAVFENIYLNVDVTGADGAGMVGNGVGENTYRNICSVGDVADHMQKFGGNTAQYSNAYEFAAGNGISQSGEGDFIRPIGKEVWTAEFYTETLGLDASVWDAAQAAERGFASLREFAVEINPMRAEIHTVADLQKMNRVPEGKFVLTADLNFADVETAYVTETFTGSLNGQAHGVSGIRGPLFAVLSGTVENLRFRNIFVKSEDAGANVLAAETKNATVKNVHFNGITLNGQSYTGLVGKDQGSTFEQISVQGVDLTANAAYAGVITAQAASSRMSNLLVAETKIHTSANEVGGLVGSADAVTIQKVFADAELHMPYQAAPQNTAAFVGSVTGESAISECVVAGGVYPQDPGSTRYKLMYMNNPDDINELKAFKNCFVNTDTPGYQIVGTDPQGVTQDSLQSEAFYQSDLKLDPNIWNWADAAKTGWPRLHEMDAEGIRPPGTEGTPAEETPLQTTVPSGYEPIHTAEELLAAKNSSGKYILMQSISLFGKKAVDGSFLGNFSGELDGNGLTIREISGAPLFDRLSGSVKNLKVTDVTVERWKSDQGANALAKSLQNAKVSRLQLKNILLAGGDNTGALAGTAQNTTISEVWAEGLNINPYGPAFAGKTDLMVGGLIAQLNGGVHVNDSYAAGEITVHSNTQGGVFGYNNYETENTVKQVVSNMRTKSTSPQTDGAGFIGMVGFDGSMATWMENNIAIGEAGENRAQGSVGEAYRFATKGNSNTAIEFGLKNCYEAAVSGRSAAVSGYLTETTEYKNPDFYRDTLKFDSTKWNFSSVAEHGYPSLVWIAGEEPLPPLPEGSAVTEHPLRTEHPSAEYIQIRTPEDLMKISENPGGKYILMNNISMEQVRLPENQTSYIMKEFSGELDGNNQVIHGLRASLFDLIRGRSVNAKATVKNLRIQNVFVTAGEKTEWGYTRKAEANGLARSVEYGHLETIYMNHVKLNGGTNTASLSGLVYESYVGKIWLEGIDINREIAPAELSNFNLVGGAIGQLSGYRSKFEDSYVQGEIVMDNNQQGGAVGEIKAALIRNVISNMEARSNQPATWRDKSGFLGSIDTFGTNGKNWWVDRCIAIGNAGANYKFLGKYQIETIEATNLTKCYELSSATGTSNVSEATIAKGTLLAAEEQQKYDVSFYRDVLTFNGNEGGADPDAWDFGSVSTKGYPTLKWLLTYDNLPITIEEPEHLEPSENQTEAQLGEEHTMELPEVVLPEEQPVLPEEEALQEELFGEEEILPE